MCSKISIFCFLIVGGDTESVDSSELEETLRTSGTWHWKVVLLVSFNVNSLDYLSVKGNLNPVAKYLKVKTRGMGKYEMAVPIAKELLRKGYVVPKDPMQKLNYNCIRRDEIRICCFGWVSIIIITKSCKLLVVFYGFVFDCIWKNNS